MNYCRVPKVLITSSFALAVVFAFTPRVLTQTMGQPEKFTANAIDMNRGHAGQLQINVTRWSLPSERATLVTALLEKGPDDLLKALQKTRSVGTMRTPDSLGYDLHYAVERPGVDGGRDIVIATDRPIRFWEAVNRPRSLDYPFTLIQMHINPDGKGEGKLAVAAKITADPDTKTIEIENFQMQPVMLTEVRSERKS